MAAAGGVEAPERLDRPARERSGGRSVLWTKLVAPRLPAGFVPRPRLDRVLDRGAEGALTLVSASPGTGKSALLSSWAASQGDVLEVAWLSLDRDDNWAPRFWAGVERALTGRARVKPTGDPVRRIVDLVTRRDIPVALILDDFQELESRSVLSAVQTLIDRAPPHLHVVLSTRADPRLRLHRLRLAGALTEIRAADLALTLDECCALLGPVADRLTTEEVETLRTRTEGWAAGMRLAALSLERTRDPARFVHRFAGDDRAVSDYLLGEILERQPPDRQTFLLRTSVPDVLTAELADELTGSRSAGAELARLEADNFLISGDGEHGTVFRYNGLLREFLRAELRRRLPAEVRRLQLRSARWHWSRGDTVPAFRSATAARDLPLAAEICAAAWHVVVLSGLEPVRMPEKRLAGFPALCLHASLTALAAGDAATGERLLALGPGDDHEFTHVVELAAARISGDTDRMARAATALLADRDDDGFDAAMRGHVRRALALAGLGACAVAAGDVDAGETHLDQALALARHESLARIAADVLAQLALVGIARGRLRRAARLAREAVALVEGHPRCAASAGTAQMALAWVSYQWDDLAAASRHAEQAVAAAAASGNRETAVAAAAIQALVLATEGPRGAEDGLRRLRAALGDLNGHTLSVRVKRLAASTEPRVLAARGDLEAALSSAGGRADTLLRSRLLLAGRHPDAALAELDEAAAELAFDARAAATESCVLESVARAELHDRSAAGEALERGLEIAGPNTHRRPFIDGGPLVRELLVQQIRNGTAHRSLVAELIAAFDRRAPKVALTQAELLEPLSPREQAVLRYLPTMMSNTEIAGELFVSGNTVKTHLKSIYRKLGVARRRDAVERARALELL